MNKIIIDAILCACILTGCGGDDNTEVNPEPIVTVSEEQVVVPPMPEIYSLNDIPAVITESYDETMRIDVSQQAAYIDTIEKQASDKIDWILNYGDGNISELNAIIAEAENQRIYYTNLSAYTYADIRMLAVTVAYESGYCTAEHQEYVAQVLLNRCSDPRFPNDIYGNLVLKNQYSPKYVQKSSADYWKSRDINMWNTCVNAAKNAMMGCVNMPSNVIYQSQYRGLGNGTWKQISVNLSGYKSTTYFNYG